MRIFRPTRLTSAPDEAEVPEVRGGEANIRFIYEEARRVFDARHDQMDKLDAKSGVLLGASGIVLAVLFDNALALENDGFLTKALLLLSGVAVATSALCALLALWPRKLTEVPDPVRLAISDLGGTEGHALAHVLHNLLRYYPQTRKKAEEKASWMKLAAACLVAGTMLLAASFVYNLIDGAQDERGQGPIETVPAPTAAATSSAAIAARPGPRLSAD